MIWLFLWFIFVYLICLLWFHLNNNNRNIKLYSSLEEFKDLLNQNGSIDVVNLTKDVRQWCGDNKYSILQYKSFHKGRTTTVFTVIKNDKFKNVHTKNH